MTDASGEVVWSGSYEAYGALSRSNGHLDFTPSYTGKQEDEDTGLYYFNARWYDPSLGRFITSDPARDGDNWYGYVENRPLSNVDPSGLFNYKTGQIESGDTLSQIVTTGNSRYGTNFTVKDIAGLNGISDPDKINAGGKLATLSEWDGHGMLTNGNALVSAMQGTNPVPIAGLDFSSVAKSMFPSSGYLDLNVTATVPVFPGVNVGPTVDIFFNSDGSMSLGLGIAAAGGLPGLSSSLMTGAGSSSAGIALSLTGSLGSAGVQAGSFWNASSGYSQSNFLETGLVAGTGAQLSASLSGISQATTLSDIADTLSSIGSWW